MTQREPSAAAALFRHLKSATPTPDVVKRRAPASVADALYPTPQQPTPQRSPESERLLRNLKELNARIDARLRREGKR